MGFIANIRLHASTGMGNPACFVVSSRCPFNAWSLAPISSRLADFFVQRKVSPKILSSNIRRASCLQTGKLFLKSDRNFSAIRIKMEDPADAGDLQEDFFGIVTF